MNKALRVEQIMNEYNELCSLGKWALALDQAHNMCLISLEKGKEMMRDLPTRQHNWHARPYVEDNREREYYQSPREALMES